jgi:hypothetical protein
LNLIYFGVRNKMEYFQGSLSAFHRGENPVIVEQPKKQNKIENRVNPIPVHGENYDIPINWTLTTRKQTGEAVCLVYWTPNDRGGHRIHSKVVLKYLYFDVKTNRTFVFTKSGTKYYLAHSNAYFNPNYKVAIDPYELTHQLTKLN